MERDIPTRLRDQTEKQNTFVEVINAEKHLWVLIQSKGILDTDVQDLHRKARTAYEHIILNDHEVVELQDVEYSLWKLHYKHIDEFRKRIKQVSTNAESNSSHVEGFKLFLSEATEFYEDLNTKFRKYCGLSQEWFLYKKGGSSFSVKPTILDKCGYASHRFLVCLGDLSRYREQLSKKTDIQNRKWAVAAGYYLEATMVWPDGGNPHNQLALLATYVGDDFLALYHSVRSLAVKEPFPDAWDNILLLFENNRSSQLHSLSSEAHFDFSKPLKRSSLQAKSHSSSDSFNRNTLESTEHVTNGKMDLWPLFVRMISFFLVKSSLEDFPCTFASTMSEFEALLAQDDTKLEASLEPYEQLDSARKGPYRGLQVVSIFIFIIHNLKEKNDIQLSAWTQLAWTSAFTCLGRFIERCLKGNNCMECCPLLAAVLVFVEWLVAMLDKAETYDADKKVSSAKSFFFGALVDLLNRLDIEEGEVKSPNHPALWEDYELWGFEPIARSHDSLDFSSHCENIGKYDGGNSSRAHRILLAAMNIVGRSNGSRNWIFYDQLARKFYAADSVCQATKENGSDLSVKGESSVVEEEEVILFKPITRYNSAPIYTSIITSDQMSLEGKGDLTAPSDECLRRATSYAAQNGSQHDLLDFRADTSNFRYNQPYSAGPPSLSAWVLNRESLDIEREGARNLTKPELTSIEEIPSMSFTNLSISEATDSAPYVAPVPSAPLLPEDPVWLRGNSLSFSESNSTLGIREGHGILGAPPVSGFLNFSPTHRPFDVSPPVLGMSSSEWLYHYTNNHNLERGNTNCQLPVHLNNVPGSLGNLLGHDASRLDLFNRWGNPFVSNRMVYLENPHLYTGSPLVYGTDEQRREKLFLGYQRPGFNGCDAGSADLRAEQPPLLQYLKEREWQLQGESPLRGPPTYMGN